MSRQRPNVWIVHQNALPPGGMGITRHADLAKVMRGHGVDVSVIASNFNHFQRGGQALMTSEKVTDHDGVKFTWVRATGYRRNGAKRMASMLGFYLRTVTGRAARYIGRPDVVIGSSPQPFAALAGLHLARLYRARFVLELRDVWPDDLVAMGALKEGGFTHRALAALTRHLEGQAERIVSAVPNLRVHLERNGIDVGKVVYVPNGVFLEDDEVPEPLPDSLERLLDDTRGTFVVMYIGTHGQAHGLHNVLDAAQLLRARSGAPDVTFVLIGGGQLRDELMEDAARRGITNVKFHPPIAKRSVAAAAARADALMVHLARVSTFDTYGRSPNKLYDYLAAGKPVLYSTTDSGSWVASTAAVLTFEPGQPAALADAVTRLAALTPAERFEMGRRGRAALEGQHDLTVLGQRMARMVQGLVSEGQREEARSAASPYS